MILYDKNKHIFYSTKINDSGYISGFTTKKNGQMKQVEERVSFIEREIPMYKTFVRPLQEHTSDLKYYDGTSVVKSLEYESTDGIFTHAINTVLSVVSADCVPILFADKKSKQIGVVHAGWKGTFGEIGGKMIDAFKSNGSNPEDIITSIGPCINVCCYNITDQRVAEIQSKFPEYTNDIFVRRDEKVYLNLVYWNYLQLINKGVKPQNIDFFPFCTSCDDSRFFSFRRDNSIQGETLSYIMQK